MLKNIILPEKIGNYYIYPIRVIGLVIDKDVISAIQIYIHAKDQVIIEKYFEENIYITQNNKNDRISDAINSILHRADKYNYINVSFPSYLVVFKELFLPFTDDAKIRSILEFEVEPIIPFSINDAVLDFIVTNKDLQKKESTILVAVARKKDVSDYLNLFTQIGIHPSKVIVDIFAQYSLYKMLNTNLSDGIVLLNIEMGYTNITYIQEGRLKLNRSLQQGFYNIAQNLSDIDKININQSIQNIFENGFNDELQDNSLNEVMNKFITNIDFTLNSFKTLLPIFSQIKKIILIGKATQVKNLNKYLESKLNIKCENYDINSIIDNKKFTSKTALPNKATLDLSIAYPSSIIANFNLLRKDLEVSDRNLLKKQLISFIALSLILLSILIGFSYLQTRKLTNTLNASKNQIINILKNKFNITDPAILRNLNETVNTANNKINEEENIWFSLSPKTRLSVLKYLQELSSIIDRQALDLNLKNLSITADLITLEGQVKDFKALETLENELNKSKLFSPITVPQETKFTIKLTIKKNEDIDNENNK